MKKSIAIFLIFVCVFSVCSCKQSKEDLKIYVLSADKIQNSMIDSEIVNVAKSDGRLAFDGNDIERYNWTVHTVTVYETASPSVLDNKSEYGGSNIFKTKDTDLFVMLIGNSLVYYGGFEHGVLNTATPIMPCICDDGRYSFKIVCDTKYTNGEDMRVSKKLYNFLNAQGLLSAK